MRISFLGFMMLLLSIVPAGGVQGQQSSASKLHECWSLKSTDGLRHAIEAIAVGSSGSAKVLYVVESAQKPLPEDGLGAVDGEYIFWKLDETGGVLHKQIVGKMSDGVPPHVTIISLPAPQEGAIIIGMFDKGFGWSLKNVDANGNITKSTKIANGPSAFLCAALLADAKSLLLAGQYDSKGNAWKVDLDGNVIWKKTYSHGDEANNTEKTVGGDKAEGTDDAFAMFYSITLADDKGGFFLAGEFGKTNKLGMGEKQTWLMKCDSEGNTVSETTFLGRLPNMCKFGNNQLAILYDAGNSFEREGKIRAFDLELRQQWEQEDRYTNVFKNDGPTICSSPSGRGFITAGCKNTQVDNKVQQELQFYQYNVEGKIISSASVPILQQAFLHTRAACKFDTAYVAAETSGISPFKVKEASIFEVSLRE